MMLKQTTVFIMGWGGGWFTGALTIAFTEWPIAVFIWPLLILVSLLTALIIKATQEPKKEARR